MLGRKTLIMHGSLKILWTSRPRLSILFTTTPPRVLSITSPKTNHPLYRGRSSIWHWHCSSSTSIWQKFELRRGPHGRLADRQGTPTTSDCMVAGRRRSGGQNHRSVLGKSFCALFNEKIWSDMACQPIYQTSSMNLVGKRSLLDLSHHLATNYYGCWALTLRLSCLAAALFYLKASWC